MPRNLLLHNSLLTRCLVAGFLLLPSVPSQASVLLVADGKANAVIVLPQAGPPGVVSYAASELQYHVQKASGVKLRIVSENAVPQQPAGRIYLGDCQATRQAKIDEHRSTRWMQEDVARLDVAVDDLTLVRDSHGTREFQDQRGARRGVDGVREEGRHRQLLEAGVLRGHLRLLHQGEAK